jgi:MFS family permease
MRWVIAALLFLSTALNYLDRQTLSILATTIQEDLKIDDVGYAKITTYFLLSYTIMYAVSGRIVDFLGTGRSLAWAVTGWSFAGMLHGVTNTVAQLSACRFLLGVFESANYPGGAKGIAEWFPLKERALGIGNVRRGRRRWSGRGVSLGELLGPPLRLAGGLCGRGGAWRGLGRAMASLLPLGAVHRRCRPARKARRSGSGRRWRIGGTFWIGRTLVLPSGLGLHFGPSLH